MLATNFPKEIQSILPILQNLDDKQKYSLIELMVSKKPATKTTKSPLGRGYLGKKVWVSDDFDDYLGDEFWLGGDN